MTKGGPNTRERDKSAMITAVVDEAGITGLQAHEVVWVPLLGVRGGLPMLVVSPKLLLWLNGHAKQRLVDRRLRRGSRGEGKPARIA